MLHGANQIDAGGLSIHGAAKGRKKYKDKISELVISMG
jgi:hypothetical protein